MAATETQAVDARLLSLRVQSIRYAARDTHLVEFARADGGLLPPAAPGAHVDLHLAKGLVRSYSLIHAGNAPAAYTVGVKLDARSRGGSRYVHEELRVGMTVDVSAPRSQFPLNEDAPHSVLIAGGIGITPIWCMVQRLEAIGASWELWYSARSRADLAFLEELKAFEPRVHLHCDDEAGGVLDLAALIAKAPGDAHLYCCGPAPMLDAYEAAAAARLRPEQVHLERFAAKEVAAVAGGFSISLARCGKTLSVPAGTSILKVLLDNGVAVDHSCQEGLCGCCEVAVLEGEVDHRDAVLSEAERASNKTMMVCCSGARSTRLVLDL